MKNIFCYLLFTAFCLGCSEQKQDLQNIQIEELYIDNLQKYNLLKIGQYSIDKVVELRMPDDTSIIQCNKMTIENSYCYVLDKVMRKVFVFDKNGKMTSALGTIGHAVNEIYREPTDFAVDVNNNDLFLFDFESEKIIRYDSLGNFLSTQRLKSTRPYAFARTNDGHFAFASRMKENFFGDTYEFATYDIEENFLNGFLPLEDHHRYTPNDMPFGRYYDKLSFIPNFSEIVYVIDSDTISKGIHIAFKTPYFNQEEIEMMKYKGYIDPIVEQTELHAECLRFFQENEYWRRIDYSMAQTKVYYLLNKQNNSVYHGINFFAGLFPFVDYTFVDDKLVFLVTAEQIELYRGFKEQLEPQEWQRNYDATNEVSKKLISGEIKAPCLLYVSISDIEN